MKKNVTLVDIARESQVSPSTVSLVMRDRPGIPPETRQRVLNVAQALGYRIRSRVEPELAAPAAGNGKLRTLGVIIKTEPNTPPQANAFYSHVINSIADACQQQRMNLLYALLPVDSRNQPTDIPPVLSENHVDGLLLVGAFMTQSLYTLLRLLSAPVVLVDAYALINAFDAVLSDNLNGAYQAVKHLVDHGHRHIGLVGTQPDGYPSLRERREGYLKALQDSGIADIYCADCDVGNDRPAKATEALLRQHPQISALFACNDSVAISAMRAAQALGRHIPDDLSIIGFDDIETAQHLNPALTTMHVDKIGMGRMAVQLLNNRLDFPDSEPVTALLRPRLIERDSVKFLK